MARRALVIRLKPDKRQAYVEHHRTIWPEVVTALEAAGHRNYSIFLRDDLLVSYFEYDEAIDIDARRRAMRASPALQRWLAIINECQQPVAGASPDEWWAPMTEVFHLD